MQDSEKYHYGDEILWFGKCYEVIQIGNVQFKNGQSSLLLYTVESKYPYEIQIFYEKSVPHRRYLNDLKSGDLYEQIVAGFQKEILKNPKIDPKYKIFEPKARRKYAKMELERKRKLLANTLRQVDNEAKNKAEELAIQLDYIKKSKEDPINYPPLKFNSSKELGDYIIFLSQNKDKIPALTPEEEKEIQEHFNNFSLFDYTYHDSETKKKV